MENIEYLVRITNTGFHTFSLSLFKKSYSNKQSYFIEVIDLYVPFSGERLKDLMLTYIDKLIEETKKKPLFIKSSFENFYVIPESLAKLIKAVKELLEFIVRKQLSFRDVLFLLEKFQLISYMSKEEYSKAADKILQFIVADKI